MSKKSYLSQQYRLITLTTTDLFTDDEFALYERIMALIAEMDRLDSEAKKNNVKKNTERKAELLAEKKSVQVQLDELILKHRGVPRSVRVAGVTDSRLLPKDCDGEPIQQFGITWNTLRASRKIAEFCSDASRFLGIKKDEVFLDKVILKWKSVEVLHQVVLDGFYIPIQMDDGSIDLRHYDMVTASAGQLRTDKVCCFSDAAWEQLRVHIQCGLDWDTINAKGGLNVSKYLAYTALDFSATDPSDFSFDNIVVVKDFSGLVTGLLDYINPDYTVERKVATVEIKHTDGCGMVLPSEFKDNRMIRSAWIKGLVSPFDFLRFCRVHDVKPEVVDAWGQKHDLVKEHITMILTASQFKLWKFYSSWEEYKTIAKMCGWGISFTNYEEAFVPDTTVNYQFIESLTDFTNEEMVQFAQRTWDKIKGIASDKASMLRTLRADEFSDQPYKRALCLYDPLLRDGFSRDTLKAIKKRWTQDAQSGRLLCANKRLFVIPDLYAFCEYLFLGEKQPKGLLENGWVACKVYKNYDKCDCLRSPHLFMEHSVRQISHSSEVYSWFTTNGIYTSIHDLISRILQFDCDGDQLNVVVNEIFVAVAERNIAEHDIVPLFYDANEVPPEIISRENIFIGLVRAHDSSGIGQVSNNLCKLWNSDEPDYHSGKLLCYYNNQVIDGAKLPVINGYEKYPEVAKRINSAVGGKNGRMPYFFQYSRNGRHNSDTKNKKKRRCKKPNDSIMNRLANYFSGIGNINMNYAGVAPFNYRMMLSSEAEDKMEDAVKLFFDMDNTNFSNIIDTSEQADSAVRVSGAGYDFVAEQIRRVMIEKYGSLENVYPAIVFALFSENNLSKSSHKQMFWRVFGDIAIDKLEQNLVACRICPDCGMSIPLWSAPHVCSGLPHGFIRCNVCGKLTPRKSSSQLKCPDCLVEFRRQYHKAYYAKSKENNG